MNTKYFKENLIGELTLTAIELVDNTDLKDINQIYGVDLDKVK